jgi:methylmalonyl-CoA/ethylmalonyl-CoA epimerase
MNLANATITQIMLPVEDFERGMEFYRDVLGLELLFTAPPSMAFFQCGPVRLLVGVHGGKGPACRGSAVYFQVDDIQAVYESLESRGVKFRTPPHVIDRSGGMELLPADFRDPDGNQLALMGQQPFAEASEHS